MIRRVSELEGLGYLEKSVKSLAVISEILVVDKGRVEHVQFRVVRAPPYHIYVQEVDVIIGCNYTDLPEIVHYEIDDRLEFSNRDEFATHPIIELETPDNTHFEVLGNLEVPRASTNFIRVGFDDQEFSLPFENQPDSRRSN
ncbi:hypothetical protein QAD02_002334 [Eretmocerus hayati]|uniref:Uncharacterized protein n=1 Tax=Eretmocerus hayati TaxID=131215 RepID=A0ACC2NIT3_9HYME|nr:hypothetical protein QAD02_002334 [Eretmocerus hayati]